MVCFAALAMTDICFALPNDNKSALRIISDSSNYNYKTGTNEFVGHVLIDQGSTHVTADRVITKSNAQHKIKEAIAYGIQQQAHYWTLPKVGDPELHAHAKIIKFYPIDSNVALEQNVTVKQGENSFQGELIHYNSSDQTIIVPHLEKSQAVLVFNPDK
jgi:lipopolysaccharide export system protein LptA